MLANMYGKKQEAPEKLDLVFHLEKSGALLFPHSDFTEQIALHQGVSLVGQTVTSAHQ